MEPTTQFLQQGLLGAIIVVLAGVIYYLSNKREKDREEIIEAQDKRIIDSQQYANSFTTTIKDMVGVNKDLSNQNATLQKSVDQMALALQKLLDKMGTKL